MLVLDTTNLEMQDRQEAFQAAVSVNSTVSVATFDADVPLEARMSVFDLGSAKVFTIESTGATLRRTRRGVHGMNECPIACALPMRTTNRLLREGGDARVFGPRDLILVDLSSPYVYDWSGAGASFAFHVEFDDLDLPMDIVRRAIREPRSSPMYDLVRDHLEHIMTSATDIESTGTGHDVGASGVELMRALIVSAAGDDRRTREALSATLLLRAQQYVRAHLREHDLDAARVAAAHGLTVPALRRLYRDSDLDLDQHLLTERLRGARSDLAAATDAPGLVADVARTWGFASVHTFISEFRDAFGFTPQSWCEATARNRVSPAFTSPTADAGDRTLHSPVRRVAAAGAKMPHLGDRA